MKFQREKISFIAVEMQKSPQQPVEKKQPISICFNQRMRSLQDWEGYSQEEFKSQLLSPVHFKNLPKSWFLS